MKGTSPHSIVTGFLVVSAQRAGICNDLLHRGCCRSRFSCFRALTIFVRNRKLVVTRILASCWPGGILSRKDFSSDSCPLHSLLTVIANRWQVKAGSWLHSLRNRYSPVSCSCRPLEGLLSFLPHDDSIGRSRSVCRGTSFPAVAHAEVIRGSRTLPLHNDFLY